jgi:hypothetical protein
MTEEQAKNLLELLDFMKNTLVDIEEELKTSNNLLLLLGEIGVNK